MNIKNIIKNEYLILAFIIILAAAVRLINLGIQPYWGDEILSLQIVKHYQGNLLGMFSYLQEIEVHPPLYYLLLSFWTKIFGYTEFFVRLLSVIFGVGIVGLTYFFCKKIYQDKKLALVASFLISVLPMQIELSQNARPYIIFCFFGLINIASLWLYLERKSKIQLALFVVSAIIGIYLHYSFILLLVATFSWWLFILIFEKKLSLKEFIVWLGSLLAVFLGFYYWLSAFLYKLFLSNDKFYLYYSMPSGTPRMISNLRNYDFISATLNQMIWLTKEHKISSIEIFVVGIFKISFFLSIIYLILSNKDKIFSILKNDISKLGYYFWLCASMVMIFLLSPSSLPYTEVTEKHIAMVSIIVILAASSLIIRMKPKIQLFLLVLFLVSVINFDLKIVGDDSEWNYEYRTKDVAEYVMSNYKKGDLIVSVYGFSRSNFNYYLKSEAIADSLFPIYPLDWKNDYLASRDTLGFMENESQSRIVEMTQSDIDFKLDYLIKKNKPKRVWIYTGDEKTDNWFKKRKYRQAFKSLGNIFPLDLYVL